MRGTTVLPGTPCDAPRAGDPPVHRLELRLPDQVPFAAGGFDAMGPMSRAAYPHRHTFYEIVHVTEGSGTHVLDLERYEVRPPQLGVILPGQVHHWEGVRGLEGSLVLFTPEFLVGGPGDEELLRRLGERPWVDLDAATHERTSRLMGDLAEEYRHGADGFAGVLRSLLHVLLVRASRLPGGGGGGGAGTGAPPRGLAEEFLRLARTAGTAGLSVRECAERIGVTPGHLTEVVRAATGRTPAALLRQERVREAQRLLVATGLPVRQVAARVGFDDAAYFCRFFRREVGRSPGRFRKDHDRRVPSIEPGGAGP
ncbi:AraC family transcriptional regulator [Streptomyces cinereoruber]|uniref:AraC family transcriptional regulator n=1 Tax=Streptomyces cinereoruber TaxID=67260 RepID=A0AAV4KDZ1_9ACTN|nr:AraC family transcriptional regulator [Streptomyces cinereoruber]MBB4156948.1 AraC-like DNA-binding protein [Streptomyces cinereoruber]MBY8815232.1 AraC family transcriptional regulator [Streptomyces cinereoruber]NIH59954.1 AraC-like DNA-binding protein [Streptomyces cinereoruber]QEV34201.1 AraC family transcriptional regulator [Streptomyces cinereoruber]GGR08982.1 AraC family transcriptional regulator [Streptomyces cinereoruber]